VTVAGIRDATALTIGLSHACALVEDASVACWGNNRQGELGREPLTPSPMATVMPGTAGTRDVAAGGSHTCAIGADGAVRCWGGNIVGQLGHGFAEEQSVTPVLVPSVAGARQLQAGGTHTCALLEEGSVHCWGLDQLGQLGRGPPTGDLLPGPVAGLGGVRAISTGWTHSCAVVASGAVHCWGFNSKGELGNDTEEMATLPVPVSGLTDAVAVSAGYGHTCALRAGGALQCWGANLFGQLGTGVNYDVRTPRSVVGLPSATAVAAARSGFYQHSCALLPGGAIRCWGGNATGQLGDGTLVDAWKPVAVLAR
jgi:alpha-tubulin suppressor-like RCC1 family protein